MAEKEMRELEVTKFERKRKKNFSVKEITVITESVRKNLEIIQSKLTNSITNKRKTEAWEEITRDVNTVGQENRTMQEVKDKWKNLHSTVKKEFSSVKRDSKKSWWWTTTKATHAVKRIIGIFENTPAFSGLSGFETSDDEGAGKYYGFNLTTTTKKTIFNLTTTTKKK